MESTQISLTIKELPDEINDIFQYGFYDGSIFNTDLPADFILI